MKTLLTLLFALSSFISFSFPADSLTLSGFVSRARAQMNIDANKGRTILDSLHSRLQTGGAHTFFWGEYYKFMGIYHYRTSNYDSCLHYYGMAREKYQLLNDELEQAKLMVNTAMVYNRLGNFDQTIVFALNALRLFENLDDKKGIGISLNIVGQVSFHNNDFQRAKTYFDKYRINALASRDTVELASAYANLGAAHDKLHQFDSALHFYQHALRLHHLKQNTYGIGNAYQNIASAYKDQGLADSAFSNYRKAHAYYSRVNNPSGLAETALNIGKTYNERGAYKRALQFLEQALAISEDIHELYIQQEALKSISFAYEKTGEVSKSLARYKDYDLLSDSIFNLQKAKTIEELNTQYETGKKEQEIIVQRSLLSAQKAELQRNYLIILACVLVLGMAIAIFALLRNRLKRRNELMRKEHEISLRETYIQASLQSQESERRRFAQDLHDGMGQLISSLKIAVSHVKEDMPIDQRMGIVRKSEEILNAMHTEIRSIAFNLMPQTLIQHGLTAALQEMALRLTDTDKINVQIKTFGAPERLSEVQEISLYRIIQEWINNVMKYAHATRAEVQIVGHEHELNVIIEDDGEGFDVAVLKQGKGNGWRNIQSRLRLIHATLDIDSTPGRKGTSFIITVPVLQSQDKTINQETAVTNTH